MQVLSRLPALHDEAWAWGLIRALADRARAGTALSVRCGLDWAAPGPLVEVGVERAGLVLDPDAEPCFQSALRLSPSVGQLLELYLPLCIGSKANALVLGHVGQSLDGQIATAGGSSRYVTGPENIVHMHRLRSLFDVVLVGAGTVEADDPELTTRLVPGSNPTRVVLDPTLRLSPQRKLFRDDLAPTVVVCEKGRAGSAKLANASLLEVAAESGLLSVPALLAALSARGLRRIFVEGGGITISNFIRAERLDRLHITICPIIIGQGRPGLCLPGVERLEQALRPKARRFDLGEDVLFDCSLTPP
jgi:diaminohydroxyphosphoribosylaminopyrimidine deaminase / 5-amino-6-(5-phosphoribosylamino)uracil reductase